jgi:hypothetical protein
MAIMWSQGLPPPGNSTTCGMPVYRAFSNCGRGVKPPVRSLFGLGPFLCPELKPSLRGLNV